MDRDIKEPNKSEEIARQLESKKQVVFYGPPGTGKTYVAQKFAKWWTGHQDVESPAQNRVQTVTFHPSFTYEDFIEGLSADSDDSGSVEYAIEDGILKKVSKRAREDYEAAEENEEPPRYVLVIDEINRGNVAQIFGETITLLEKDKRGTVSTQLAHSDESFTIPPNLYIIGTMNTADRSISLVDAALRRRFRFIPFAPEMETLSMYHGINNLKESAESGEDGYEVLLAMSILAVKQINERILNTPDLGKGKQIGHSYLMDLENTQGIVDTWKYDILPLLEEYYFSQFDRIRQDIFEGGGSELVDWESERIGDFDAKDLLDALEELVDIDTVDVSVSSVGSSSSEEGSGKITSEREMLEDAEKKLEKGEISQDVYDSFVELYEFAQEIGDDIDIKRTQNASFGLQVDAHLGEYSSNPNVFTANISGKLSIWGAKFPITAAEGEKPVNWGFEEYERYLERFQSLEGVTEDDKADFDVLTRGDNLEEFKDMVGEFVSHCKEAER